MTVTTCCATQRALRYMAMAGTSQGVKGVQAPDKGATWQSGRLAVWHELARVAMQDPKHEARRQAPPTLSSTAVSSITTAPWKATCSASGAVTLWLPTSTFATEVDMGRKGGEREYRYQ